MNWETLLAIIGAVGGATGLIELVKYFATRKAQQRQAESQADMIAINVDSEEWHIWKDQLDRMNEQIEFKDKRIVELNKRIDELMQDNNDKTKRLRDSQDREYESQMEIRRQNGEILRLTEENNELRNIRCRKGRCAYRQPQTDETKKAIMELGLDIEIEELPTRDPELKFEIKEKVKGKRHG